MRARLLKPGLFLNETLAEVPPLGRLLFEALWCLADRDGRVEDRPRRIKAEVLPYDDADADALLNDLAHAGFILRYEVDGLRCIQIVNFTKHQHPHRNEPDGELPAPPADTADASGPTNVPSTSANGRSASANVRRAPAEAEAEADTESETVAEAEAVREPDAAPVAPDGARAAAALRALGIKPDGASLLAMARVLDRFPGADHEMLAPACGDWWRRNKRKSASVAAYLNWIKRDATGFPARASPQSTRGQPNELRAMAFLDEIIAREEAGA